MGAHALDPLPVGPPALTGPARRDEGGQGADALARIADAGEGIRIVDGKELVEHGLRKLLRSRGNRQSQSEESGK